MTARRTQATPPADAEEWRQPIDGRNGAELLIESQSEDEPEQSPSERVAALLSDVADDDERAVVKVLRQNVEGRYEFCDDYTPADFEAGGLSMIRRQWGAGNFRVCLYAYAPGTRRYAIRKREQITLAKLAPGAEPSPSMQRQVAHGGTSDTPPAWLPLLLERLAPLAPPASAPDALAQFKDMLGMFTMMREAMGIAPAQRSTISEVVEAVRELRDVAGEFNGEKPEEADPMLATVNKIVELVRASVSPTLASVPAVQLPAPLEPVPMPPPAPHDPAEGPPTEPQEAPAPPSGEAQVGIAVLVGYLRSLFMLAAQGKPPEAGVDLVVEKLPDDFIDLLRGPTWWDLLVQSFPEATPHRAWLTQVREASLVEFAQIEHEERAAALGASQATQGGDARKA